jgi:hypothetical protein
MSLQGRLASAAEQNRAELLRKRLNDPRRHPFDPCFCSITAFSDHCRLCVQAPDQHATTVESPGLSAGVPASPGRAEGTPGDSTAAAAEVA